MSQNISEDPNLSQILSGKFEKRVLRNVSWSDEIIFYIANKCRTTILIYHAIDV